MTEPVNEIPREQAELFPVDNPEMTDGPGSLPRRAVPMLRMLLDEFQKTFDKVMAHPKQVDGVERTWMIDRMVNVFGQVYLMAVLRHLAPEDADAVAAALADQWDAGDSLGEWVYQWRQELDAGEPLTMPFVIAGEPS